MEKEEYCHIKYKVIIIVITFFFFLLIMIIRVYSIQAKYQMTDCRIGGFFSHLFACCSLHLNSIVFLCVKGFIWLVFFRFISLSYQSSFMHKLCIKKTGGLLSPYCWVNYFVCFFCACGLYSVPLTGIRYVYLRKNNQKVKEKANHLRCFWTFVVYIVFSTIFPKWSAEIDYNDSLSYSFFWTANNIWIII